MQAAIEQADVHDDAAVRVVFRVEDQRLEGSIRLSARRWNARHHSLEHLGDSDPLTRTGQQRIARIETHHLGDLAPHQIRVCRREIDLVDDRHDLEVVLDRLMGVRERLCLHALGRVDEEECALACRQRP